MKKTTTFAKGNIPWNKGTKGLVKPNSGCFKKGEHTSVTTEFKPKQTPWNKGKEYTQILWEKHPLFKTGEKRYRDYAKRSGFLPICIECGKEGEFGYNFHIHHINHDRNDNRLENLQVLCAKCHKRLHVKEALYA